MQQGLFGLTRKLVISSSGAQIKDLERLDKILLNSFQQFGICAFLSQLESIYYE